MEEETEFSSINDDDFIHDIVGVDFNIILHLKE